MVSLAYLTPEAVESERRALKVVAEEIAREMVTLRDRLCDLGCRQFAVESRINALTVLLTDDAALAVEVPY